MFDDPEPELGVVDEGDGGFGSAGDLVIAALEIDGVVVVDAALLAKGKVEVEQRRGGCGAEALGAGQQGVFPDGEGDEAGAALAGAVLALEFHLKDVVGVLGGGDFGVGQEGDEAALEGAETAFDFAFRLRTGGDEVGDAQRGEGALELGAGIAPIGRRLVAEQSEAIGVQRQRQAVAGEGATEVVEVVPGGIGGHEGAGEEFAGMIIHGEQQGLFVVGRPPLVNGGVVLPEFVDPRALPAPPGLGAGGGRADQEREVAARVGGHRFAVAVEGKAGGQFVRDELIIGRALQWEEGLQELLDRVRPSGAVIAAGEAEREGGAVLEPSRAEAEEVGATDAQELSGGVWIEGAAVESVQCLVEEAECEACRELMFGMVSLNARPAHRASLFVSLATLGLLKA